MKSLYTLCKLMLVLIYLYGTAWAQDPIFSQPSNKLCLNPALTGDDRGTTIYSSLRNQWWRFEQDLVKFETRSVGVAVEAPRLRSAFGLFYHSNTEGEGNLQWNSAGVSYAYEVPFAEYKRGERRPRHRDPRDNEDTQGAVRFGINLSHNWRNITWDNLVYTAQLDPVRGIIPSASNIPPGLEINPGASYWDMSAGAHFFYDRLQLGLAANHLSRPDQSLFQNQTLGASKLPIRWTLYGSYIFSRWFADRAYKKNLLQIVPTFRMELQRSAFSEDIFPTTLGNPYFRSIDYGVIIAAQPKRENTSYYMGIMHHNHGLFPSEQHTNALILLLGLTFDQSYRGRGNVARGAIYRFAVSYDYNITGLGTETRGTLEFSLTINFPNATTLERGRSRGYRARKCPAMSM